MRHDEIPVITELDAARIREPDESTRRIRILELHYQPEAAGEFTR